MFTKEILDRVKNYNDFTKVDSLDYFESENCTENIKVIYNELVKASSRLDELYIDEVFQKNNKIVEFFLLDLWERVREGYFIRIEGLYSKTNSLTQKEQDIFGAMESLMSHAIREDGIEIYCHYMNFKKRL